MKDGRGDLAPTNRFLLKGKCLFNCWFHYNLVFSQPYGGHRRLIVVTSKETGFTRHSSDTKGRKDRQLDAFGIFVFFLAHVINFVLYFNSL